MTLQRIADSSDSSSSAHGVLTDRGEFRADIEGLRAVAVGLVVLNHLDGRPSGGFIGVDVFFVVSGFLITGLLLSDTERHGRLSFRRFYSRRARRILPGALTVLAAEVIAAPVVFRGARVSQTYSDVRWALGFAAPPDSSGWSGRSTGPDEASRAKPAQRRLG
jgi:peptidoglycan/LPS O-acetylase OafA/YrhL